jgi:hypothetical protein
MPVIHAAAAVMVTVVLRQLHRMILGSLELCRRNRGRSRGQRGRNGELGRRTGADDEN